MDYLYGCTAQDSVCLLIRPKDFFAQQFRVDSIPFFCRNDTIVKVNFKVKELLNENDFHKKKIDLKNNELRQIKSYFTTTAEMEAAKDAAGFYWVEKTNEKGPIAQPGDLVTIQYRGEFLNGRFLEQSPGKFEFVYGTPDQLLKGINYVIGELKVGENAKIILPSHLAYGETGSSNGTVPPFTPLVYQIKILEIEKQHQP